MFVITTDQRGSTRKGDRVPQLLEALTTWQRPWESAVIRVPERTVGDEVQLVLADADAAVDCALLLLRMQEWSVGIGAGAVDEPLGATARSSSGEAFVHARKAVERARGKGEPVPVVVCADDSGRQEEATAIMQLLGAVVRRRNDAGWEVTDALVDGVTQKAVADSLGVSPQAVSQRVAAAMLEEERRARPVAAALLTRAEAG